MDIISSVNNDNVKRASSLLEKKYRRFYGSFLVEGIKLVSEVLLTDLVVDKIYIQSDYLFKYEEIYKTNPEKVLVLSKVAFNKISDTVSSQGIIAEVKMRPSLDFKANQPFLVLDRISDPGNLGTIIRTAIATGFKNIVLLDSSDPYNPKTVRSSAGGIFYVNFYPLDFKEFEEACKKADCQIYIADMNGENIFTFKNTSEVYALVIGNEGGGVCEQIRKIASRVISLPMKVEMESLNAGVSASVIMYELKKDELL